MAKNPESVATFLEELAVKLQPLWDKERDVMLKLKAQLFKSLLKSCR